MKHSRRSTRIIPLIKASTSPYQHDEKIPVVKSKLAIKAQVILDALAQMNVLATGFKETGGLHDSGIFMADGKMLLSARTLVAITRWTKSSAKRH